MSTSLARNDSLSRYELYVDEELVGSADYQDIGSAVVIPHTGIDPSKRGQGLGETLVKLALDDLREKGKKVVPACSFVFSYIQTHPEYADMVEE